MCNKRLLTNIRRSACLFSARRSLRCARPARRMSAPVKCGQKLFAYGIKLAYNFLIDCIVRNCEVTADEETAQEAFGKSEQDMLQHHERYAVKLKCVEWLKQWF